MLPLSHQVAVCNLASLALNRYVTPDRKFDFKKLEQVTGVIVRNLNRVIDVNFYPVPEVSSDVVISQCHTFILFVILEYSVSGTTFH